MRSRSSALPAVFLLVLAAGLVVPERAGALSYISVEAGRFVLGNPYTEGDVSPILSTLGAAVPIIELGLFRFEVSTLLWGTVYEYVPASATEPARVVPTQWETANQIGVLGIWATPLASVHVPLAAGKIEIGAAAGVAFNLRFPIYQLDDDGNGIADDVGAAYAYFWAGRFIFPETRLWIRWFAFDDFALSLTASVLYPAFHLVDGGPFLDQFVFALIAGFDLRIPERASAPAASPEAGAQGGSSEGGP